jgi:hypothetical protein
VGNYALGTLVLLCGLFAMYFGVRNPRGDAWGPGWKYVLGGVIFAILGVVFIGAEIGWL